MLFNYVLVIALAATSTKQLLRVIDSIPDKTWEATDSSHVAQMSDDAFKALLMEAKYLRSKGHQENGPFVVRKDVPESYDIRTAHPKCAGKVFDKGVCSSGWAFAATSTFSDRLCIAGKTKKSVALSQQYQISCDIKNSGCTGGYLAKAWNFYRSVGVPTLHCVGYTNEAFEDGKAVPCPKKCDDDSDISLYKVRKRGRTIIGNPDRVKTIIYEEGPVLTGLTVYEDFKLYKKGVYKHLTGNEVGALATEIIGYGTEGGVDFWIARNCWGKNWGEDGFFRIVRGTNECAIENEVIAGNV